MHQSRKKMPVRELLNNFYFYHQNKRNIGLNIQVIL